VGLPLRTLHETPAEGVVRAAEGRSGSIFGKDGQARVGPRCGAHKPYNIYHNISIDKNQCFKNHRRIIMESRLGARTDLYSF